MKKPFSHCSIPALLIVLSLSTILSSCKKDEKVEILRKNFRMTSIESSDDGDFYKTKFTYTADNKIQRFSENINGVEISRIDWAYNENEVIITESLLTQGEWVTEDSYEKLTYSEGRLAESAMYNHETLAYKTIYNWEGELLMKETKEFYNTGKVTTAYRVEYTYENSRLTGAELYYGSELMHKQVIEYLEGKPAALKTYNASNVLEASLEMIYSGKNIITTNSFQVIQGNQGNIQCTENRTYNVNNCATTITTLCYRPHSSLITYEKGASNYNDYILTQASWISAYLYPNSFPCELVYK